MPKRDDIEKVMIIGSGPVLPGQGAEYDSLGRRAVTALKEAGCRVVAVDSDPATTLTDPDLADAAYLEPLTVEALTGIIEAERPDGLLPNLGGQTGLNLAWELARSGVLDEFGVELLGAGRAAIEAAEDRLRLKTILGELGLELIPGEAATSLAEAEAIAGRLGFPVVIRPAATFGGLGGGLVYNTEELRLVADRGLKASPIGQVLVQESALGWTELELEVVRDVENRKVVAGGLENVDGVGINNGDSITVAPMLTIAPELRARLERQAFDIIEALGVVGGINVQFGHDPSTDRTAVIDVTPRLSRSSTLTARATGFPLAKASALLALGLTLDEIPYRGGGLDRFNPPDKPVAVRIPRWPFEKFGEAEDRLGPQMRSLGEALGLGRTFKEAFQKAVRALESERRGLGFVEDFHRLALDELLQLLWEPSSQRPFIIYEALRKGGAVEDIHDRTHIKPWFIEQIKELVELEENILEHQGHIPPPELFKAAKQAGFADKYLAQILGASEDEIRRGRLASRLGPAFEPAPSGESEGAAGYYSTYHAADRPLPGEGERRALILGGGPTRIGHGVAFDHCALTAASGLKAAGWRASAVNANPAAVLAETEAIDRLYLEPLTVEDVLAVFDRERPEGVIVQFGGQKALSLAVELAAAGVRILGVSPETIDLADDMDRFRAAMKRLGVPQPDYGPAGSLDEALALAEKMGYPVIVWPSKRLTGSVMDVVHDEAMLKDSLARAGEVSPQRPVMLEKFLENSIEADVDAVADGEDAFVPAVMEHIELAGIHSGDSAVVIPPVGIAPKHIDTIEEYTKKIAAELNVVGPLNVQFAILNETVYVLEAKPRATRTVPLVSKVTGIPLARIAAELILGKKLDELGLKRPLLSHFGVKEAVFPFETFPEVDPVLGPRMRSSGAVLGLADSYGLAFHKAQQAAGQELPARGTVLITVGDQDKPRALEVARKFAELGFTIKATKGTLEKLTEHGIEAEMILKMHEGRPNIADAIQNGEIQLVVNTPTGKYSRSEGSEIRKAAVRFRVPYVTTTAAALSAARGVAARRRGSGSVKSLKDYHGQS